MNYIKHKSLGYDPRAILTIDLNGQNYATDQYTSLRNDLMGNPYIVNVSRHDANVVGGLGNGWTTTENLKGEEISTSLYRMNVDSNYFNTYDMKLAAGRFFSHLVSSDTSRAVLVNEAAVRTFGWQRPENAIGKRFGKGKNEEFVIGVVKDFNFESLHKPVEALMMGYANQGGAISIKIDARHINEVTSILKKTWNASLPGVPLQYAFIDESIERQYGSEEKMLGLFYCFAGLSLVIACTGLFGLSIFVVERKVKEIGIRKVLGANVPVIVGLISKDFLKLVIISAFIACPLAYYLMHQWLQNFAYRITIGWQVFVISGLIAVCIALVTISFRAIKAALANPVKCLRME
jgi:putative ABC transport system permease protein